VTDHDVTDYDPRVNDMLERQVPLRLDAQADWAAALSKAEAEDARESANDGVAQRSDGGRNHHPYGRLAEWVGLRMRSRRLLAPALVLVVLVVAGAATAAGVRWWSGPPTPSAIDTTEATKLVEYTLMADFSVWKAGDTIAIWRMPQPDGSVCTFRALASVKPSAPGTDGPNPVGGGSCGMSGEQLSAGKPIGVSLSTTRQPSGGYSWLIDGTVSSGSGIARLELRSPTGRLPLAYSHGWFLGQLPPRSSSASDLPQGGPYVVVGYDSQGTAVERLDLQVHPN